MECRKGVSLIRILIQYMFLCGFTACLIAVSFWIGLNLLVNKGVAYPANAGERMAAEAAERMKKEGISRELVPFLCSYAIWENGELAETDMNDEERAAAEEYRESGKDSGGYYHVKAEEEGKEAVLQFQYKMELINPEVRKLIPDVEKWYFIFWGAVLIVSLGLVTHRYVKIFRRRLSVLQDAALSLSRGELEEPFGSSGIREYDEVMDAMEELRTALRNSLQEQWKMEHSRISQTSALLHDLKTPLTIISGNAQLLEETPLTEEQQECLSAILKNTEAAGRYLERLKRMTRNVSEGEENKQPVSGELLQQEIFNGAEEIARVFGVKAECEGAVLPELILARQDVCRAVLNIVRNAAEHTPEEKRIVIHCRWQAPLLEICVSDEGPGFSPQALCHALEPMYTEGESRPQDGHMGIGLAFSREVARFHSGEVQIENTPEGHGKVSFRIRPESREPHKEGKEQEI